MMYMHYCKRCHHVHMLNGHRRECPNCNGSITELKIPYMDYVSMDRDARELFLVRLEDDVQLKCLSTTYRMFKYSKWYKKQLSEQREEQLDEQHKLLSQSALIPYLAGEPMMDNAVSAI